MGTDDSEVAVEADPAVLRPRSLAWWRWLSLLAAALLALGGGLGSHPTLPPLALATYTGHFSGGPRSTALNNGYGSLAQLAAVTTPSYRASVAPDSVGEAFLDVSPSTLRSAHFVMYAKPPGRGWESVPVTFGADGFVGYRRRQPLSPGTWTFRLEAERIGVLPQWTVVVRDPVRPPAATPAGLKALWFLNAARSLQGSDAVAWSARLALASARHARYVGHLGYHHPSFHVEKQGPYYSGTYPWTRDLAAGWPDSSTGEVGIAGSPSVSGPLFIAELLDTVFHRLGLLSPNAYAAGFGADAGPRTTAEVMDIAYGYRSNLPKVVVYPNPGQQGVATTWTDLESPSPVQGGVGQLFGYPITLDCPTVDKLSMVSADLTRRSGTVVSTVFDRPGQGAMASNQLALVPLSPLAPDTTYVVTVVALSVRYNDGTTGSLVERWTFRTGGGAQSVYLATHGRRLLIAVDLAGVGTPRPETVGVTLSRAGRRLALTARVTGGVGSVELPRGLTGAWQVVVRTPHGNRGTTTWQA